MQRLPLLLVLAAYSAALLPSCLMAETIDLADGALQFDAPEGWTLVEPRSRILERELSVAPPEGVEATPARLTVMRAGGSVEANLQRWVGQFQQRTEEPTPEMFVVGEMPVSMLRVRGTYLESAGGPFGPKTARKAYQLVGAIVTTVDQGNYFFKLIGPEATVAPAEATFRKLVESLKQP